MRCPFAKWKGPLPSGAYYRNPSDKTKIGAVFHVIVGSEDSANGEFHNGNVGLSAHFGIADGSDTDDADGDVIQWIDTDDIAYAQAAGNWPPTAYVAIECAGNVNYPMSTPQVASGIRLTSWLAHELSFPIIYVPHGTPGVTTHCNTDGSPDPNWGNHPCPGLTRLAQVRDVIVPAAAGMGGIMSAWGPDGAAPADQVADERRSKIREWWHLKYGVAVEPSPANQYVAMLTWAQKGGDLTQAAILDGTIHP